MVCGRFTSTDVWSDASDGCRIWPGTIPGMPPIGIRFINHVEISQEETRAFNTNFEFPHEIELLTGGTFGDDLGFFGQTEFKHPNTVALQQAFLKIQDPL